MKYSANVDDTPKEQSEEDKQREKERYKERAEQAKKKREAVDKQRAQIQILAAKSAGDKVAEEKDNGKDN